MDSMHPLESKVIVDGKHRGVVVKRKRVAREYLVLMEHGAGWFAENRVERDGQTRLEAA